MNDKIEALVRTWHEAYAEGEDVWGTEDLIRKVATEAWEQATEQEREGCARAIEDLSGPHDPLIAKYIRARGQGKEQGDE